MSLGTIIHAGLTRPARICHALVLMGGGARTAYQVGVLQALGAMLKLQPDRPNRFPFQVLVGTSAGALNVAFLAGTAATGLGSFELLSHFWGRIDSDHVYRMEGVPGWVRFSRLLAAVKLWGQARKQGAILNNMPLVDTLHKAISLEGIEEAFKSGALDAIRCSMVRGWNSARRPGRFHGSIQLSRAVWQNVQCTPLL